MQQFQRWFEEATRNEVPDPNAMVLATAPVTVVLRCIVLLRGHDERGFAFFTNYESRKACELKANPHAGLVFTGMTWSGKSGSRGGRTRFGPGVRYVFPEPPGRLQAGAWASHQSAVIPDREILEDRFERSASVAHGQIPAPNTGADIVSSPRRSNSGRVDQAGYTTGCGTPAAKRMADRTPLA